MFNPYAVEQLKWYVYALKDPRDGRVFYVGKGYGNRVFAHAKDAHGSPDADGVSPRLELIREIHEDGLEVETHILRHGLESQKQAYEVEAAVIDVLQLLDRSLDNDLFALTNLVKGHHHATKGLATTTDAASLFNTEPMPGVTEPIIFFNIPKLWTPSMSNYELYEATQGWWHVGERALRARYAGAVRNNVIRGIYRIDYWRERVQGDRDWAEDVGRTPRRGFRGLPAPEMSHWLRTNIKHLPSGGSIRYWEVPDASGPALTTLDSGEEAALRRQQEVVTGWPPPSTTSS